MKVVFHLLTKDVTRLRAPLMVWIVLFVLQLASLGWWPGANAEDPRLQLILVILKNLVPPLQMIVLLVIVPLLVHEDPVVGSTAFWLTRPISGRLLLASKALFAVLFLIITPLMVDLAGLAGRGDSGKELVLAVSAIALGRVKFLLLVFILAALTQTFSRFALTGVVLVVSYVIAGLLALVIGLYATRESGVAMVSFMGGSGALADLTTIGFGAAVIINQYLTRKTVRSWLLLAAGMIAVFALGRFRAEEPMRPPAPSEPRATALEAA
jgi:hypothetical protein